MSYIHELNLLNLNCPMPQIYTKQKLQQIPYGDSLQVTVSYLECYNAIIQIARSMGCIIQQAGTIPNGYLILIYKPI